MTAIEKMEHYLMTVDRNIVSFGDILDKVKELAKEEAAKDSQDYKGLVKELDELRKYMHQYDVEDWIQKFDEILAKFKGEK